MTGKLVVVVVLLPFLAGLALGEQPRDRRDVVTRLADPEIVESSGLVAADDLLVTVNDSGDAGRTFVVDASQPAGVTVGHATWGEATDVEALAPIEDDVLVGDIGDNAAERDTVSVLRVPLRRGESAVDPASAVELVYPDGPRDAETLLVDPVEDTVLIASKEVLGGTLYAVPDVAVPPRVDAPAPVEPVRLQPVGRVRSLATDGAFFPDGRHLVVRGYGEATVYSWPDLRDVGTVEMPRQEQGEGIAVADVGRGAERRFEVLVSSEGRDSPVLRVDLPQALAQAVAPRSTSGGGADGGGAGDADGGAADARDAVPVDGTDPQPEPPLGPWLVGGGVMLVALVLLIRSLRPR